MTVRHLRTTFLVTLALCGLVAGCDTEHSGKPALPAAQTGAPKISVPTLTSGPQRGGKVASRDMSIERYVATALPKQEAELGPRMSGTLVSIDVQEGQKVKKGQVLFRLDTRSTRLNVAQAETSLQGAEIARENAKRELERQEQLAAKGTIAAAVLERAQSAYNSAENGVSQAGVMLSMARRGTSDSATISPIDGIVAHKFKDVGETVTMMPPTVVVVIQDQSVLEVRARVPEAALRLVHVGDQVTAHFSALGAALEARVVRIQPTVDAATRTIEIVADVDNKDGALRPGMYVELELRPPLASVVASSAAPEPAPEAEAAAKVNDRSTKQPSEPPPPAGTH